MNPKIALGLRIVLFAFMGMCAVILLTVNKISASIILLVAAVVVLLPISESKKWLRWGRVAFVVVVFALVAANISTTDYPANYYNTGFKFFDQVLHIFDGFFTKCF